MSALTGPRLWVELVSHELEIAIRSRRVAGVAVLYLLIALAVGYGSVRAIEAAEAAVVSATSAQVGAPEEATRAALESASTPMLESLLAGLGIEVEEISPALKSSPLIAGFLLGSLFLLPWLVAFASFDAISADLASRSLCYETLKISRVELLLAKFVALLVLLLCVTAACGIAILGVGLTRLTGLDLGEVVRGGARSLAALVPYTAAYLALSLLCSAATKTPIFALVANVALRTVLAIADHWSDSPGPARFLSLASPGRYDLGLWHVPGTSLALSVAAYCAITAVALAATAMLLQRRDL